jgi:polyhydroxybutyrate depolymerase
MARPRNVHLWLFALLLAGACARAPAASGETFRWDGLERRYDIARPDRAAGPLPLVVVLHGGGGSGAQVARQTGFDALARSQGFVAVFPDGIGRQWNDGRVAGRPSVADDAGFLAALIADLAARGIADPGRVYVAGISNGGLMTLALACRAGTPIAGIAVVSASRPADWTCPGQRPMPALFIHGTADPIMPWDGGAITLLGWADRGRVAGLPATVAEWQATNGCGPPASALLPDRDPDDGTRVALDRYACPPGRALALLRVIGGGHAWPGSERRFVLVPSRTSRDIDATALIWTFFLDGGL